MSENESPKPPSLRKVVATVLRDLLGRKKFVMFMLAKLTALFAAIAGFLAAKFGADLDPALCLEWSGAAAKWVLISGASLIGAQGAADIGKEKARAEAEAKAKEQEKPEEPG